MLDAALLNLGRPLLPPAKAMSTCSPASPSPPLHYACHTVPSSALAARAGAPAAADDDDDDDLFSPTSPAAGAGAAQDHPARTARLRPSPVSVTPALPGAADGRADKGVVAVASDESGRAGGAGLGRAFGAQLRRGSRAAPWEEEDGVDDEPQTSDGEGAEAGNTDGDHEAGWAALGLAVVDRVERRGGAQATALQRSPPTTMYLRPISAREQYGRPQTPHANSLSQAMYAFPSPEADSSGSGDGGMAAAGFASPSSRISSYYSPVASRLAHGAGGLPSPSPSPEQDQRQQHVAAATPTHVRRGPAFADVTQVSSARSKAFSGSAPSPASTVLNKRGVAQKQAQRTTAANKMESLMLGLEHDTKKREPTPAAAPLPTPSPAAHAQLPPVLQKVLKPKKSLLKMFSKSAAASSSSASSSTPPPPVPAGAYLSSASPNPASGAHYQKASAAREVFAEQAAREQALVAPMSQVSVRGCGASDLERSPSPSELSLRLEPLSWCASPPPSGMVPSATDRSLASIRSDVTASPAVKPLKLRPISQAWTAGLPVDFLSLPPSPAPSAASNTFLSPPMAVAHLTPSPRASTSSSFAPASPWSDASSFAGSEPSVSYSVPSELPADEDGLAARLERELKDARKAWQIERFEYQSQIRDLKAQLAAFESSGARPSSTLLPTSPSVGESTELLSVVPATPVIEEKVGIMDRARVKTAGGRAAFGRGDLRT